MTIKLYFTCPFLPSPSLLPLSSLSPPSLLPFSSLPSLLPLPLSSLSPPSPLQSFAEAEEPYEYPPLVDTQTIVILVLLIVGSAVLLVMALTQRYV